MYISKLTYNKISKNLSVPSGSISVLTAVYRSINQPMPVKTIKQNVSNSPTKKNTKKLTNNITKVQLKPTTTTQQAIYDTLKSFNLTKSVKDLSPTANQSMLDTSPMSPDEYVIRFQGNDIKNFTNPISLEKELDRTLAKSSIKNVSKNIKRAFAKISNEHKNLSTLPYYQRHQHI